MEMKVYHCTDPKENPVHGWLRGAAPAEPKQEKTLVERFKENPDSFFPEFVQQGSRTPKRRGRP